MSLEDSIRPHIAETVFGRVLVGVDDSDESREAARQAAMLAENTLTLLAAYDIAALVGGSGTGVPAYYDADLQRDAATSAVRRVQAVTDSAATQTAKVVRGVAWDALINEAEREQHTLIAVGSHGHGRIAGVVMGSVATAIIHKARGSVLVARHTPGDFPSRIVVGVDGSAGSAAAYAVAVQLANRFDADLWPVVAYGGKDVDRGAIDQFVKHRVEALPDDPVTTLVTVAGDANLVIVGSRGLHGLRRLGSVSERTAHQARSSVLIVRQPDGNEAAGNLRVPSRHLTTNSSE